MPKSVFPAPQGKTTMPLLATPSRANIFDNARCWYGLKVAAGFRSATSSGFRSLLSCLYSYSCCKGKRNICAADFTASTRNEFTSTDAGTCTAWASSPPFCARGATRLAAMSGCAHNFRSNLMSAASRKCLPSRSTIFNFPNDAPWLRMKAANRSSKTFLDCRANTLMMSSASTPVEMAAFKDNIVTWYSCMTSGRLTGSATVIKKSVTCVACGWNASNTMRPSGQTHKGRLLWSGCKRSCKKLLLAPDATVPPPPPPQRLSTVAGNKEYRSWPKSCSAPSSSPAPAAFGVGLRGNGAAGSEGTVSEGTGERDGMEGAGIEAQRCGCR
mmetsp:Transcript_113768/g.321737  ORF Transcript_113768/g.321737 Transcript_113768/m.321737 type:complete len:328 (-) Transcript_113768:202-1185(-)